MKTKNEILLELEYAFSNREELKELDGAVHAAGLHIKELLKELKKRKFKEEYERFHQLNENWIDAELERRYEEIDNR